MKKITAVLLAIAMVFALVACTNGSNNNAANNSGNESAEPPVWPNGEVTILLGYQAGSLTDVGTSAVKDWLIDQTKVKVSIEYDEKGGGATLAPKLAKAAPDGQTLMLFGLNCIANYYNGIWTVDPTDTSLFKPVTGTIQPYPYSGCTLLTNAENPYTSWEELEKYIKENPGKVTVMDIPGKVMDTKTKALFYARGLEEMVVWAPTDSKSCTNELLGNNINIVMLDESTASGLLADPEIGKKVKVVVNCRPDNDFSYYDPSTANLDMIKSWPTLYDVFGAEFAAKYSVPNTSFYVVPAGTPDSIVAQIKKVIDGLADVPASTDPNSFYVRQRVAGGTSKYYAFDGETLTKEYKNAAEIVKAILGK